MSTMALQLPMNYVEIDREEMEYIDGGWSMAQVGRNITGMIACFSMGYLGYSLQKFVAANKDLKYSQFLIRMGSTAWNFIKCAPLHVQIACGVSVAATVYAIGSFDLF